MRPIKFRSWNGANMISPDYITRDGRAHWAENSIPTSTYILMQFTGLLDKNGKEIYEGDIVKGLFNEKRNSIYSVYFHQEVLAWFLQSETNMNIHLCDLLEIEIIGNIYENPELLSN